MQAHLAKATSHCLLDTKELYSGDTGNGRERRVRKWTDQIGAPVSPNSHCVGSGAWCPRWRPHTGCVGHPGTATPGPPRYTWWTTQMSPFHCSAERKTIRLFISCLHLMTSSAERAHQVIHQLLTPYDRDIISLQSRERPSGYSSVAYTWWQGDHGFIEADSDHWVSHQSPLSVQLEVMCLSNYSTSFKAKRLTLWMPTDQQSVRHNWCVRFQFLCWLYHLKDNWIISLKKGWSVPSLLVRSTAL